MTSSTTYKSLTSKIRKWFSKNGIRQGLEIPLVLTCLKGLNAEDKQLEEYFELSTKDLTPSNVHQEDEKMIKATWSFYLGEEAYFSSYLEFFKSYLEKHGKDITLRQFLPKLIRGCATLEFRGIQKLGLSIENDDQDEMALGLALMASSYFPSPLGDSDKMAVSPGRQLQYLFDLFESEKVYLEGNMQKRIEIIYKNPTFVSGLRRINVDPTKPLNAIAGIISNLFIENRHSTLLAAVTSCHAIRQILPYVEDTKALVNYYWHAICAATITVVKSDFSSMPLDLESEERSWDEIQKLAIQSQNDQTISLAYSCKQEEDFYSKDVYKKLVLSDILSPAQFI